ncbi:MAG: GerMN domain-containing protein [Armatimonadota bacterium]|nr:GerMN domain-containing protein [Armatimonadota bacterium]
MARARRSTLILTSLKLLLFLTAVGAGGYVGVQVLNDKGWTPTRVAARPSGQSNIRPTGQNQSNSVRVYIVKISGNEARLTPLTYQVAKSADRRKAAIEKQIAISARGGDSAGLIPRGTRVLSLNVDRGLATLDLSREFVNNFHGGSRQESLTVEAILRTLTQFREITRVRILVEGRSVDTLGGHLVLSEPLSDKSLRSPSGVSD